MQKGTAREAYVYEYRVEMLSDMEGKKVTREFQSEFEVGECWGYNRFYRIDQLESEGYLNEEDTLKLKFYVRPPSYAQLCRDQQRHISEMESKVFQ
jgi:tripartite motif-containing protein 37